VYDAIAAGFTKVVFIIRRDFEQEFKSKITDKFNDKIQVEFAFQDIEDLPNGFSCPEGREKPWGTGHAILSAAKLIDGPFNAINGDDYYGRESFKTIANFYARESNAFTLVAFRLENTLSIFGSVTRGLCEVKNDRLVTVIETDDLRKTNSGITSDRDIDLNGSEPVSMNMWGFTPVIFDYLQEMFVDFLAQEGDELKSEFLIPSVINDLIQSGKENVHVLYSNAPWFGVTYKKDKPYVVDQIQKLINIDFYPRKLFG
jgi:UTP-glucose-1-phosphate uridylyltransferase